MSRADTPRARPDSCDVCGAEADLIPMDDGIHFLLLCRVCWEKRDAD